MRCEMAKPSTQKKCAILKGTLAFSSFRVENHDEQKIYYQPAMCHSVVYIYKYSSNKKNTYTYTTSETLCLPARTAKIVKCSGDRTNKQAFAKRWLWRNVSSLVYTHIRTHRDTAQNIQFGRYGLLSNLYRHPCMSSRPVRLNETISKLKAIQNARSQVDTNTHTRRKKNEETKISRQRKRLSLQKTRKKKWQKKNSILAERPNRKKKYLT